ncbi:LysM peptidoglycan-binding domain-containing protein [Tyzzerella nexilis]|nr:LysM peptidoglycan-binding domain-containing protein [[Clostridium] nexile]MCB7556299.1 LysM peptidoglycan-binding domain-containing protein [[Clostridium] nexile]MCC3674196.1 LysM peptidoglycan-binding domain-containing protein [[Clostridium] nexile]NSD84242.1 LysM peptidoglycan-binding domain-containing protein [[Clostridium] nexile]NSD86696.1 LysM peptidoglycan-binding domain-containing protein [[Clostridium] nexile]
MPIHVVKSGETIYSIAQLYDVSADRIVYDNELAAQQNLVPGQALLILMPSRVHIVREGQTVEQIAEEYSITVKNLYQNNPFLLNQTYLLEGQSLVISYGGEPLMQGRISGYAYPFIEPYILREVLLYIDEILIFSYGFTVEGELIPPQIDETWVIQEAWNQQVEPILVLTPFAETGTFNSGLIQILSENETVQDNLIENLLETVREKGYVGVDVDFEYIRPEDRVGYADFVNRLRETMNENGYRVSVALAPKTSSYQKGLLYEAMDYHLLGQSANTVFLMTYEWGYTYGPPLPVAPLPNVRQVLEYALTEIPKEKIVLGIPNYGYSWPLPYERGVTKARLIGNVEANVIAAERGVEIQYDERYQSPFFYYEIGGRRYEVWFEDVRSIYAKLQLAAEKDIRGVGYWNLMRPFRANWLLVNQMLH